MSQKNWRWSDANFSSLPSHVNIFGITTTPQTNIYLHSKILEPDGSNKLVIASLAGKIVLVEYQRNFDKLIPSTKEIHFTYIPADAELISLDVINRCGCDNGVIVGITFIKQKQGIEEGDNTCTQYLNIYSCYEPGEESCLESIALGCVMIDLDFVPYQLTHTQIFSVNEKEDVFLLGGSDNRIHLYREFQHRFREEDPSELFPEFLDVDSCVQWLDIVYFDDNKRRMTAIGQQDGFARLSVVDVHTLEILYKFKVEHDSPITSIQIFSPHSNVSAPSFINSDKILANENEDPLYHLLVVSALSPAVVYRDVLKNGLEDLLVLPGSNSYDIPLCVCVMDVDFDGQNEILVGTYGQELLAYKFMDADSLKLEHVNGDIRRTPKETQCDENTRKNRHKSSECKHSKDFDEELSTSLSRKAKSQENIPFSFDQKEGQDISCLVNIYDGANFVSVHEKERYALLWQRSFACPVMGVDRLDIVGDGLDDLIVVTLRGVHIVQPDLLAVAKVCSERLHLLSNMIQHDDKNDNKEENPS